MFCRTAVRWNIWIQVGIGALSPLLIVLRLLDGLDELNTLQPHHKTAEKLNGGSNRWRNKKPGVYFSEQSSIHASVYVK